MLKKEHEILKAFIEKPWQKFTFKEIKTLAKKKSDSYVYNSMKRFVKEKILSRERAGNVVLYYLNLACAKSQVYAGMAAEHIAWNKRHIPYADLNGMLSKIPANFFTLIVTGSYASNKQSAESDIDVVIICDSSANAQKIYAELRYSCEINIPPIHLYVFKESEFIEMLLDKKANYGKEIAKNNLILYGSEVYFKIIAEAIKNGFNG